MANYFAQVPDDRENVVSLVMREVEDEWQAGQLPFLTLDHCVRDAVDTLWQSEIKTFVPLLALRRVRSCIRAGSGNSINW